MTIFRFAISKAFICSLAAALNRMDTRFVLCKASLSITLRLQRLGRETLMDALRGLLEAKSYVPAICLKPLTKMNVSWLTINSSVKKT